MVEMTLDARAGVSPQRTTSGFEDFSALCNRVKNKLQGRNSCRMDKSTEQVTPPVIKKAKRERG